MQARQKKSGKMPKVSVLVPIYNVEEYLHQCLDSLVTQTIKNIEIICLNDGSTDNSLKIIEEYAAKDSRIVVVDKKNSGYGASMNKGLAKARGKYIGIVESDDWAEPDMFEKLYKLAEKHSAEVVKSNYFDFFERLDEDSPNWCSERKAVYDNEQRCIVREHNRVNHFLPHWQVEHVVDPSYSSEIFYVKPAIWSAIYSRDFLEKNDIKFTETPGASYQDTAFSFKVWASAHRVYLTDQAYLHYRRDNEVSSVNSPKKIFCIKDEYDEISRWSSIHDPENIFRDLMWRMKFGSYKWNLERLGDKSYQKFLRTFSDEFLKASKDDLLNYSYFPLDDMRFLNQLMHNPERYTAQRQAIENAKVSIVVPVYNAADFLDDCIESLLSQTMSDIEILCIDDCSTDASVEILEKYAEQDPRIIIMENPENAGRSDTRNKGIYHSHTPFLMFCDSDDFFEPTMCEKMYEAVNKNRSDLAHCGMNIVYETKKRNRALEKSDAEYYTIHYQGTNDINDRSIMRNDLSVCNKIYRRSTLDQFDIKFPIKIDYEDAYFNIAYQLVSKKITYLPNDHLYNYRRQDINSIMSSTYEKTPKAIDHLIIMLHVFEFLKKHGLTADHQLLFSRFFHDYFLFAKNHAPEYLSDKIDQMLLGFINENKKYLDDINPELILRLQLLLPHGYRDYYSPKSRLKRKVASFTAKVMSGISLNYRRQKRIIEQLDRVEELLQKVQN